MEVTGRILYASQEAWVFSGTLRENILFGQPYQSDRYNAIIEACALDKVGSVFLVLVGMRRNRVGYEHRLNSFALVYTSVLLPSSSLPFFHQDIALLVDGDLTLVGERGVTLSGGQKARVNLARVIYHDADIYLLDDPLSAVDAGVARHLFEK